MGNSHSPGWLSFTEQGPAGQGRVAFVSVHAYAESRAQGHPRQAALRCYARSPYQGAPHALWPGLATATGLMGRSVLADPANSCSHNIHGSSASPVPRSQRCGRPWSMVYGHNRVLPSGDVAVGKGSGMEESYMKPARVGKAQRGIHGGHTPTEWEKFGAASGGCGASSRPTILLQDVALLLGVDQEGRTEALSRGSKGLRYPSLAADDQWWHNFH